MSGYTKLFGSIIHSTVWQAPGSTRLVWITMLALADQYGVIEASIPGLAKVAGVELGECQEALHAFQSPDTFSRTPDNEGRRIEVVDGGWRLLNHSKYRERKSRDDVREKTAERVRRFRDKKKSAASGGLIVTHESNAPVTHVTAGNPIAEAEAPSGDPDQGLDTCPTSQHPDPDRARDSNALPPFRSPARPYPPGAATLPFLAVFNRYTNHYAKARAAAVWQELAAGFEGGEAGLRDSILAAFNGGMLVRHPYNAEISKRPSFERVLAERQWEDPASPVDVSKGVAPPNPYCEFHRQPNSRGRKSFKASQGCPECKHVAALTRPKADGEPTAAAELLKAGGKK